MAGFLKHVSALTYKNFINWRRTWFGSLLEIIMPVACMVAIGQIHNLQNPINNQEQAYLDQAYAFYPTTEPVGIRWIPSSMNQYPVTLGFLDFANITKSKNDFQRRNPQFFKPLHCYAQNITNLTSEQLITRNYTAIGYVQNYNNIESSVITQLKLIFQGQADLKSGYHPYSWKKFQRVKDVQDYVRHPNYTYTSDRPGLCFAFNIQKHSDSRYEVDLMFNDQMDKDLAGSAIPRQGLPAWSPIDPVANIPAFKKYVKEGYSFMQNLIANTILRYATNGTAEAQIAMVIVPTNQQSYTSDPLIQSVLVQYLPYCTLVAYLFPVFRTCSRMVSEKQTGVRDSMRMMGLSELAYWFSWLLYYAIINIVITSLCTGVLYGFLFKHSDWTLVWAFFFCYGLSLFGFVTIVQAFFQNSRYAAIFAAILYIALHLVHYLVAGYEISQTNKEYASLVPQVAVFLMVPALGAFESVGIGLQQSNAAVAFQNFIFNRGLGILLLDFAMYTIFGIYLDNIMPRDSGQQKHWTYIFHFVKASYWDCFDLCRKKVKTQEYTELKTFDTGSRKDVEAPDLDFETKYIARENFEDPEVALLQLEKKRRFLKIIDLEKQFSNGFKAVNGINIRMYEGQIFALLGHNGAGKTTTIQMMTGMLQPTNGEAYVYGYNMFGQDMETIRKYMGVCPQHNVLFDLLTPEETLAVFQVFKGSAGTTQEQKLERENLLKDSGIYDFRNTLGKNLSGGNKRKLSVAIALCGQSKFILLDEPTAGMDLQARRNLWNMLRAYRTGRIIILTTHYMDEADVLGDRIGIMRSGRLVTVGSSLFLKKRFGIGYHLTVEQESEPLVTKFLKENLGEDVKFVSQAANEVTYQVPTDYNSKFKEFFVLFDSKLEELSVHSYGITVTTLEEVFLKAGEENHPELPQEVANDNLVKDQDPDQGLIDDYSIVDKSEGNCCTNMKAMCMKRGMLQRRQTKNLFAEVLLPVVFVILGITITQIQFFKDSPSRSLLTNLFPLPQRIKMNSQPIIPTPLNESMQWVDTISVPPIVKNFPNSYSLLSNQDFIANYTNYTEGYSNYLVLKKNLTVANLNLIANGQATNLTINATKVDLSYDLFSLFNDDFFDMRNDGDAEPYRFGSYLVYQADPDLNTYKVITYVNTTSQDVAAAYPQFMYQAILKSATGNPNFQFKLNTLPFPIEQKYLDQEKTTSTLSLISVIAFGLSMIPANIVGTILQERERNLKHLQMISGLNLFAYYFVNLFFDILKTEITMGLCCLMFYAFQLTDYYWAMTTLMLFPWAVVPATYAMSFLFTKEWSAQLVTVLFSILSMMLLPIIVVLLQFFSQTIELGDQLNFYFRIIPMYNISRSLLFCGFSKTLQRFRKSNRLPEFEMNPWTTDNIQGDCMASAAHFLFSYILILFLEGVLYLPCWQRCFQKSFVALISKKIVHRDESLVDSDVIAEETKVESIDPKDLEVRVNKLRKVYVTGLRSATLAVDRASFGLELGECFALLGVNGAGKTTVFKSLTNEVVPTQGSVSICGFDASNDFTKVRKMIGFCPQENVLFDQLSVEEHLVFYALIKGIKASLLHKIVQQTIKKLDLVEHKDKRSESLSGGNKRKLQVAIAIIGNPKIILLDEPSAGMDPEARRFMWSVLAKLRQKRKKCSVILTTHSMEEAEALSTKMGIMVNGGNFKCMGSTHHIKHKFGVGYEIEVKIRPLTPAQHTHLLNLFHINSYVTKMNLRTAMEQMKISQFPQELLDQISIEGMGAELVREANMDTSMNISITHLMEWVHIMKHGMRVVRTLCADFGTVELLEQYGDYFKLRVLRQQKSIGFVFGLIEEKKEEFSIAEYSASQTTLEQIFQLFANEDQKKENGRMKFQLKPDTVFGLEMI